ncbi:MAG: DNA cytosine methyltransferase [Victivallales bacterium]|nr:DNA cytosine methyltransferase [Victivallales bacterium]
MPIRSIELFTGAGGLALGLEKAGCHHEAMFEFNGQACDTIRYNIAHGQSLARNWKIHQTDVRTVRYAELVDSIELVAGGPPCQPFSMGGKARGRNDARDMFPEAVRAVRELSPRSFVFENVKGLLRESFASYFNYIVLQLSYPSVTRKENEEWTEHLSRLEKIHTSGHLPELSYRVVYRLLNAADYGIPQYRHRVFIVGFRSDLGLEWHFPQMTHCMDRLLWEQWVSGEYWDTHKVAAKYRPMLQNDVKSRVEWLKSNYCLIEPPGLRYRTVRDALVGLPDPREANAIPNHQFRDGARPYPGHTGSQLDEPSKALKAGAHGVPGGENMIAFPDGSFRYYTAREAARIQTFPDDYVFDSPWTEAMRQIGNAVPTRLAERVGQSILAQLV